MKRFLIVSMVAGSFCGLAAVANAAPVQQGAARQINVSQQCTGRHTGCNTQQDIMRQINMSASVLPQSGYSPYMLAKLQNQIQMLQTELQTLGSLKGQTPGGPRYVFDAEPPSDFNGSPVPTGG